MLTSVVLLNQHTRYSPFTIRWDMTFIMAKKILIYRFTPVTDLNGLLYSSFLRSLARGGGGTTTNDDEGQYHLTHIFDELLEEKSPRSRKQTGNSKSSKRSFKFGNLPV